MSLGIFFFVRLSVFVGNEDEYRSTFSPMHWSEEPCAPSFYLFSIGSSWKVTFSLLMECWIHCRRTACGFSWTLGNDCGPTPTRLQEFKRWIFGRNNLIEEVYKSYVLENCKWTSISVGSCLPTTSMIESYSSTVNVHKSEKNCRCRSFTRDSNGSNWAYWQQH